MRVHRRHHVRSRFQHRSMHVISRRARLVRRGHHLLTVDVVLHEVRRGDLFHEHRIGFDEKVIFFPGDARRDVVVGEVDVDEMTYQPVRRRELAPQRPFGFAHRIA
jgi:hypothetical protein